jgi:hypothetical protein
MIAAGVVASSRPSRACAPVQREQQQRLWWMGWVGRMQLMVRHEQVGQDDLWRVKLVAAETTQRAAMQPHAGTGSVEVKQPQPKQRRVLQEWRAGT